VPNPVDPHTVDVAVKGFTWSAAFSGATFVTILTAIGMLFRSGGVDAFKEWNRARKERRDEDREDEMGDRKQLSELSERMTRMSGAFAFLANAVTTAIDGLGNDDQAAREVTASRARELVALAVSTLGNEDPFIKALDRVASVVPVTRGN